jgi:hypothetical protein
MVTFLRREARGFAGRAVSQSSLLGRADEVIE